MKLKLNTASVFSDIKILFHQGKQYIPDVTTVDVPGIFSGRPVISATAREESAGAAAAAVSFGREESAAAAAAAVSIRERRVGRGSGSSSLVMSGGGNIGASAQY